MRTPLIICMLCVLALPGIDTAAADKGGFAGTIAPTVEGSNPDWPKQPNAPKGAPNIVIILLDDIGFADTSTFGGLAQTPQLEQFAKRGLRYNNFNVTAMCSPTRAALLTGRNHHRVGFGIITEGANGYPGYNSYWKDSTASVAKVLQLNGYSTAAFGKWHNTPEWEITPAGPFKHWPTGLGFEQFYGFMGAEDNQWEPNRLFRGTTPVEAPASAGSPYYMTTDLVDEAVAWVDRQRSFSPDKPYFLYFATGAVHTPHHAPAEWIARYRGKFDRGWDALRADIFERQKQLGVIPADTELTPQPPQIPAWSSLSDGERRLYARQMEVYAAYIAYTDHEVGRLLRAIEHGPNGGENTLIFYVVGDNGALGQNLRNYGGISSLDDQLAEIDELGGPRVPFNENNGGWGWMGNTPFKYWKTVAAYFGGLRAPMIVSWPSRIRNTGTLRQQFEHVTDIVPTIYDAIGITPPQTVDGVAQQSMDGTSMLATFTDAGAKAAHMTQYFEIGGNRALYRDGWMASALSPFLAPGGDPDHWELYNVSKDFSQAHDLSATNPAKLAELKALFDREAWANDVYPIPGAAWSASEKPFATNGSKQFRFYHPAGRIPWAQIPSFNRSFAIDAEVFLPSHNVSGAIATFGFRNKGFAWYVRDGHLIFENRAGLQRDLVMSDERLAGGATALRFEFDCDACTADGKSAAPIAGTLRMFVNGKKVAEQHLAAVNLKNGGEAFAFHVGRTGGSRISDSFDAPFPFTGEIKRLTITVD